jgi:hypothetical protein
VTVDEMDLVRQLNDAAPLRPEAYERARTKLRGAMAESGPRPEADSRPGVFPVLGRGFSRPGNRRRRSLGTLGKVGIGAGIGAAAAAVAIVLVATSTPQSAPRQSAAPTSGTTGSAPQAPAAGSKLVTLADVIKAGGGSLPGNASLVIRTQTIGDRPPDVSYNLYADNGAFYGGGDVSSLREAVARHQNLADGIDAREVAAARYAAAGNLTAARERMVNATPNWFALGQGPAAQRTAWKKAMATEWPILKAKGVKTPPKQPTGKALQDDINNYVWNDSVDALSAGAGNPQVRAGVLRLLSSIPEVTVVNSRTGGQPTLTLTAGPALFGGGTEQVLTISAKTGMPVKSVMTAEPNVPASVDTFKVLRVTLAQIEAGKF